MKTFEIHTKKKHHVDNPKIIGNGREKLAIEPDEMKTFEIHKKKLHVDNPKIKDF